MSKFEKIIVSLIDDNIKLIDLTDTAGFVDCYTYDPDNPSGDNEFYMVYDGDKMNDYTKDRAIRFSYARNLKRTYVKYVNGKPLYIYSFWVNPTLKKLYSGTIWLNTEQKAKVVMFWGAFSDVADSVMSYPVLSTEVGHQMPLNDYRRSYFDIEGITIKKEAPSK